MNPVDKRLIKGRFQPKLVFCLLFMLCVFFWGCVVDSPSNTIVGGECRYAAFDGEAEIVSIDLLGSGSGGDAEEVEIKFLFVPEEPLEEGLFRPQKAYTLQTEDFRSPTLGFVKKNDLAAGKVVDAQMEIIHKGTCTPLIFHFPGLQD